MFVLGLVTAFSLLPLVYADGYSCKPLEVRSKGVGFATFERYLHVGDQITIYATPTDEFLKRNITLFSGEPREKQNGSDISYQLLHEKNHHNEFASKSRNKYYLWGYSQSRDGPYFQNFVEGKRFKLTIDIQSGGYNVTLNDKILEFVGNHEPFYNSVKSIEVAGFKLDTPIKTCEKAKDLKIDDHHMNIVITNGVIETRTWYRK
ncbi:unnamed protein product [Caenorhabditis auriculariae]|uniref:Galectin n=1 Tax=Caenorhabditis auriculariae TaxID=2777116 RepID=A0A8S1GSK3_9PELO|nr:unnamed protein product [Caenorhabditis auriculariae]